MKTVGVTVLGDFILSEGIGPILENLVASGCTAVAVNPTVTAEAPEGEGSFQPPPDAGTSPRLFDRPLFGKRALWVKSAVSYSPDASKYEHSPYGPREPVELTHSDGHVIGEFIAAAVGRGAGWRYAQGRPPPRLSSRMDLDLPRRDSSLTYILAVTI